VINIILKNINRKHLMKIVYSLFDNLPYTVFNKEQRKYIVIQKMFTETELKYFFPLIIKRLLMSQFIITKHNFSEALPYIGKTIDLRTQMGLDIRNIIYKINVLKLLDCKNSIKQISKRHFPNYIPDVLFCHCEEHSDEAISMNTKKEIVSRSQ
jgi:hypothetical protein